MKQKLFLSLFLWLSVVYGAVAASSNPGQLIFKYLQSLSRSGQFDGAVLVAKNNQIVLRQGFGFANRELKIAFTPETKMHVASISKMFTAFAILKLRDQGVLKLTDSICLHLKDCPSQWQAVNIRHLLRHTSGIPDYEKELGLYSQAYENFMTKPNATAQIMLEARSKALEFSPGTKFSYSNTGYVLLGEIIQNVSGKAFNNFLEEQVFKPAGLNNSFMFDVLNPPKNLALGYGKFGSVPQLALAPPAGDAALISTTDDLYRWSLLMDGSRFVPQKLATEIFRPGLEDYGYGWFVFRAYGTSFIRHTGELPGHRIVFVKMPARGITLIVFCNDHTQNTEAIAKKIISFL